MSSAAKVRWNWKCEIFVFSCFTEGGKAVLHGVTSWAEGCAMPKYPGTVFANVFQMMRFVEHVLVKLLCTVGSFNMSDLEAYAGFLRLLMIGWSDPYVLRPFDKKLFF